MSDSKTERIEWGRQLDCEANGCDPPHPDADSVYRWHFEGAKTTPHPSTFDEPPQISRAKPHAIRWVRRTVTTTPWESADPKLSRTGES